MNLSTRDSILVAMFAALTAVGAFIKIPIGVVPFTLQFLFCAYAGLILGSRKGLYSQALYVLVGLIGLPVFTKGGGPLYVLQPTFGFLLGFILCAYAIGRGTERLKELSIIRLLAAVFSGLTLLYLSGLTYLYLILNLYLGKEMPVMKVLAIGFFPFIIPDIIISILVAFSALKVLPLLRQLGYLEEN